MTGHTGNTTLTTRVALFKHFTFMSVVEHAGEIEQLNKTYKLTNIAEGNRFLCELNIVDYPLGPFRPVNATF